MPHRAFIPSADQRFGYLNDIALNKRPPTYQYNSNAKHFQLYSTIATGIDNWHREVVKNSVVVEVDRFTDVSKPGAARHSWKLSFGPNSPFNTSGRLLSSEVDHKTNALLQAVLAALQAFNNIQKADKNIKYLYILIPSETIVRVLGWGENVDLVRKEKKFPLKLSQMFRSAGVSIKKLEGPRCSVRFWLRNGQS